MTISDIYISEAVRIRKEYLESINNINKYQNDINQYKNELNSYREELNRNRNITETQFKEKLEEIDICLAKVKDKLQPFFDTIKTLDEDQRKLYNTIKEKYINISDDDIKNNILNAIKNIK